MLDAALPIPSEVLCESCGYRLAGLPPTTNCPECGTPAATSLPERRTGSPWQLALSPAAPASSRPRLLALLRAWLATAALALTSPIRLFSITRLTAPTISAASPPQLAPGNRTLLWTNLLLASLLLTIGVGLVHAAFAPPLVIYPDGPTIRSEIGDPVTPAPVVRYFVADTSLLTSAPLLIPVFILLLLALTALETIGLRTFGSRRGWRITRPVAWSVVSHASAGWLAAGLLAMLLHALAQLSAFHPHLLDLYSLLDQHLNFFGFTWATTTRWMPTTLGLFIGMLVFETIVYFGVRRCRFAN